MKNKTLYLHIGSHKTGTSSIQRFLALNPELLFKHDFELFSLSPEGEIVDTGELNCWVHVEDRPFRAYFKDGLVATLSSNITRNNVIMSCESLSWIFNKDDIVRIYDELSKFFDSIKVICYIRSQDEHLISHFQQASKYMFEPALKYYGDNIGLLPLSEKSFDEYLNYEDRLYIWEKVFGEENIIVREFSSNKLVNSDAILDFLSVLGIAHEGDTIRINESIGYQQQIIGQVLNKHGIDKQHIRNEILSLSKNKSKVSVADEFRTKIHQRYSNSNKALSLKYDVSLSNVKLNGITVNEQLTQEVNLSHELIESLVLEVALLKGQKNKLINGLRDLCSEDSDYTINKVKVLKHLKSIKNKTPVIDALIETFSSKDNI